MLIYLSSFEKLEPNSSYYSSELKLESSTVNLNSNKTLIKFFRKYFVSNLVSSSRMAGCYGDGLSSLESLSCCPSWGRRIINVLKLFTES